MCGRGDESFRRRWAYDGQFRADPRTDVARAATDVPDDGSVGVRDVRQSVICDANSSLYRFILKFINFGTYYSLSFFHY